MMPLTKSEVMYGTLDLLVLKTLEALGPQHGYAVARRIEQVSRETLHLNQGTLYPALLRLENGGWISSKWGTTENNRKARYYSISKSGRKRLQEEARNWEQMAETINRALQGAF
jgi:PadR family transcriptional regulator, regulatory protein PadR